MHKENLASMSNSPIISETCIFSTPQIFSHTHTHIHIHHSFFTFHAFLEKKERKIISSSASKNLFCTIRSITRSSSVGKPARSDRSDHVSPSSRAENRVAPFLERSPLKYRSVTFDQRPRHVFPLHHGLVIYRPHVRRGKQCCLSTSRSEPLDKVVESISKHGLTLANLR